jgi:glycosyltransferase involved in cell wall biosynthesis
MKIAIVNKHPFDVVGGSEIQCDLIAGELHRRGHEIMYLAVDGKRRSYEVSYRVRPIAGPGLVALWREFRKFRPDVVYWRHNKKGLCAAVVAARALGAALVYSMSHVTDSQKWAFSGSVIASKSAPGFGYGLIRASKKLLFGLRSRLNYSAMVWGASGVVTNNAEFLKNIPVRHKIAIHNSLQPGGPPFDWPRPYVAWVANIKRRKHPELFVKLARSLKDTEVDFLMVGRIQEEAYRWLEIEEGVPENFHMLGPMPPREVNGFLQRSLFLVHTCEPEGFPNNILQAWNAGKPVVSLNFDPEGLLEQQGLGRHSVTWENFERDVRDLINEPETRSAIGLRAREYVTKNF